MRATSSTTSNVFSRLTAPTKATIGKSRRVEDRKTRDEWRREMDAKMEQEEEDMNMGGFVLKEQRYKKTLGSRSPMGVKATKRSATAATVGKISKGGTLNYPGSPHKTTTRTIWKNGITQTISTTSYKSSKTQYRGASSSSQTHHHISGGSKWKQIIYEIIGDEGQVEYVTEDGSLVDAELIKGSPEKHITYEIVKEGGEGQINYELSEGK